MPRDRRRASSRFGCCSRRSTSRYHYDFRDYAQASLKRRAGAGAASGSAAATHLRRCRSGCCTIASAFAALLQYLTVQVSDMFRDPALLPRPARAASCRCCATYPSLKIWVAGCSTGEEAYSLAILLREEGLLERTIIYATDINAGEPRARPQAGVYRSTASRQFTRQPPRRPAARGSLSDYYHAAYGAAVIDQSLQKRIVFSDHSLATDSVFAEVQLVSCRNVLIYFDRALQDRALGLFTRIAVPHAASSASAPRRRCASPPTRRASSRSGATPGSTRSWHDDRHQPRRSGRHRRLGRRLRRRSRQLLPALPPTLRVPVVIVLHLPQDRPSALVEHLRPRRRAAGQGGRRQGAAGARHRLLRAARLPPARRVDAHGRAVGRRTGALLAAVDRRAVRVGRRGLRQRPARHHPDRRQPGWRGRPRRDRARRRHRDGSVAGQRGTRRRCRRRR